MNSTVVTSLKEWDAKNRLWHTILIYLSYFQPSGQGKINKEGWGEKLDTRWPLKEKE